MDPAYAASIAENVLHSNVASSANPGLPSLPPPPKSGGEALSRTPGSASEPPSDVANPKGDARPNKKARVPKPVETCSLIEYGLCTVLKLLM